MPGSQRCFCSSLVRSLKYGPTTSLCRLSAGAGTPALAISSSMIALNRKSSEPPPPNSSGMLNPMSPYLPAAMYADRSTMRSASHFSALGTSSLLDVTHGRCRGTPRARRRRSFASLFSYFAYFAFQTGWRFCAKASGPSLASSVLNQRARFRAWSCFQPGSSAAIDTVVGADRRPACWPERPAAR